MGEWKPGDVAMVNGRVCIKCDNGWEHGDPRVFKFAPHPDLEVRPLVVIDPEAVLREGTFDPDAVGEDALSRIINNVADHLDTNDDVPAWVAVLRALASAVAPSVPKPDEPTGLGAVVEDENGTQWIKIDIHKDCNDWTVVGNRENPVDKTRRWKYANITAVRVLSQGVTP